jgi:hypothetical protein
MAAVAPLRPPPAPDPCASEREHLRRAQVDLEASEAVVDRARQHFDLALNLSGLSPSAQATWRRVVLGQERLPTPAETYRTPAPRAVWEAARHLLQQLDLLVEREELRDAGRRALDACLARQGHQR